MQIEDYNRLSSIMAPGQVQAVQNNVPAAGYEEERKASKSDSYTPSEAFPVVSGMYGASGREVEAIPAVQGASESSEVSGQASGAPSAGGSAPAGGGGGASGDDEEETTTQIVRINGVTYLETTTTTNGVSTTTRRAIGSEDA